MGENDSTDSQNTVSAGTALSFGEKAVGLTFNPSGDAGVQQIKQLYAQILDIVVGLSVNGSQITFKSQIVDEAIKQAMSAQMWAVKAVTWKD